MWEVISYGERPYWEMSNQDVSVLEKMETHTFSCVLFKLKSAPLMSNIFTNIIPTSRGGQPQSRAACPCKYDFSPYRKRSDDNVFRSLIKLELPVFNTSQ